MQRIIFSVFILTALFLVPTNASATVFEFDCVVSSTCSNSDGAGKMIASLFSFNDVTLDFSWTATFDTSGTETPDGVWFVVNHGPEPEDSDKGLAIFYGDGASGRVSAHVYDNDKKRKSFELGNFLETYPGAVSFIPLGGDLVEMNVSINVATVNGAFPGDPDWQGLFFQDTIGFWTAVVSDTEMEFDGDGAVTHFRFDERTSYDRSDRLTTPTNGEMPAPATLWLLASGLLGLGLRRRRQT